MRRAAFIAFLSASALACGSGAGDAPEHGPVAYLDTRDPDQPGVFLDLASGEVLGAPDLPRMGFAEPVVADVDGAGDALYVFGSRSIGWATLLPSWLRRGLYRIGVRGGSVPVSTLLRLRPGEQHPTEVGALGCGLWGIRSAVFAPGRNVMYANGWLRSGSWGQPQPQIFLGIDAATGQITDTLVVATEAYPATARFEPDSVLVTAQLQPYEVAASPNGRWLATVASYAPSSQWITAPGRDGATFVGSGPGDFASTRVLLLFDLDTGSVVFEQEVGTSGAPAFTSDGEALFVTSSEHPDPNALVPRPSVQHLLRLDLAALDLDTVLTLPRGTRGGLYNPLTPLPDRPSVVARESDGHRNVRLRELDADGAEIGGADFPFPPGPLAASGSTLYLLESPRRLSENEEPSVLHHIDTAAWRWVRSDTLAVPLYGRASLHVLHR